MSITVLLLAMAVRVPLAGSCVAASPVRGTLLFLEPVRASAADTTVSVRLCLGSSRSAVGSYSATLTFDSTVMRATRVNVTGGMQVANANVAGVVRIAGAAPSGFSPGQLATIVFNKKRGLALGKIKLTLAEASAPSGTSILADARVAGYPSSDRALGVVQTRMAMPGSDDKRRTPVLSRATTIPRIDSIQPRAGHVDAEGVLDIVIYGSGFAAAGNVVSFDAATIDGLASERGGTIVRFMAPPMIPAHDKLQARRVEIGTYGVKIRTPAGTSNTVTFTARGDDR